MKQYDITIIGGGIHGVGVAQAAAARGYRTLLIEKSSLAAGTSSKSSKLVHGGLRYLESGQLKLVAESIRERTILLKLAPALVNPVKFYLPVYKDTSRSAFYIGLGLALYSLLGKFSVRARFRLIPKKNWSGLGGLETENLRHVFQYWDAQTDDRKLTEAVMRSATLLGAEMACPATFSHAKKLSSGYEIQYRNEHEELVCSTKVVVNAAGPWANIVLDRITPVTSMKMVDLVQGSHVVVKQPAPPGVFYVEAPRDKRAVFMMPWQGHTMIGTTEALFTGNPDDVRPSREEIDYLLSVARHYFPGWQLDELQRFAGLRVLPRGDSNAFNRPRETILYQDEAHPGLYTIYGGKLTGYRATAEKLLDRISEIIKPENPGQILNTSQLPLSGT